MLGKRKIRESDLLYMFALGVTGKDNTAQEDYHSCYYCY